MSARTVGFVRLVESRTVFYAFTNIAESIERTHVAGVGDVIPGVPWRTPRKTLCSEQVHRCPSPIDKEALCALRRHRVAAAAGRVTVRTGASRQLFELTSGTVVETVGCSIGSEEAGHA